MNKKKKIYFVTPQSACLSRLLKGACRWRDNNLQRVRQAHPDSSKLLNRI